MVTYRTFRNTDPPAVVGLWRSRQAQPGLLQPVSVDLIEDLVFAKLYFDYRGMILAWDGDQPVGFAHAGFGPDEAQQQVVRRFGVTCVIVVRPGTAEREIADDLLTHCEQYLAQCGAEVLYGGAIRPLNPFYLGLYGGSELPGVLQSDALAQQTFRARGYREIDQTVILQRDLGTFQAPVDHKLMQLRRKMTVQATSDAPTRNWWEACTLGSFDLTRFELQPRGGGPVVARAVFRSMDPPMGGPGFVRQAGLVELEVDADNRRQGLATYLLGEAFTTLYRQGITLVEAQTMIHNPAALGLYTRLGLCQVGQGSVFRKDGS